MKKGKPRWVAVSGGFDPIHVGHVRMFLKARKLGDKLAVILNNDNWLQAKKGYVFMSQADRAEILKSFPFVDRVYVTKHAIKDPDRSINKALKVLRPTIFANGGDRKSMKDIPEAAACKELGIKMVFNVGGSKVRSSSWLAQDVSRPVMRTIRPWGEFYRWDSGKLWNLKTMYVKPGKRLSLQKHARRSESWILVEGDATATIVSPKGKRKRTVLKKGSVFVVPPKTIHRVESRKGGTFVEIAFGRFDESDIVRIADDYGRA